MAYDDGGTGLHDACLFGGDQLHPITKIGLMIQRNRHDDGDGRIVDHIGRIETPTQTNLHDGCIGGLFRKKHEHRGSQDFENRDRLACIGSFNTAQRIRKDSILDITAHFPVNADTITFVPVHQMWRGMDVHGKACRLQKCSAKGRDGTLTIGASNMDNRWHSVLGIAEFFKKTGNSVERKIEPLGVELHQLFNDLLGLTDRGLRHVFRSPFRRFACHLSAAPKMKSCNV